MGTMVTFKRPDGKDASGYLAKAGAKAPGIVVIQEWWGCRTRSRASAIASRSQARGPGARSLRRYGRPLPRHGGSQPGDDLARLPRRDRPDRPRRASSPEGRRQGRAHRLLHRRRGHHYRRLPYPRAHRRGVLLRNSARAGREARRRKVPLQGQFADSDDWCTPAVVDAFETGLEAAGKPAEFYRYAAEHGFVNEQRDTVHDRVAAELAWQRTLAFFGNHLA